MNVRTLGFSIVAAAAVVSTANAATISLARVGPTLAATTGAACSNPDALPNLVDIAPIEIPQIAMIERGAAGPFGSATVEVDLNEAGDVQSSAIAQSSGDTLLDDEALSVVRSSRFTAEVHGCKALAGAYAVVVDFDNSAY